MKNDNPLIDLKQGDKIIVIQSFGEISEPIECLGSVLYVGSKTVTVLSDRDLDDVSSINHRFAIATGTIAPTDDFIFGVAKDLYAKNYDINTGKEIYDRKDGDYKEDCKNRVIRAISNPVYVQAKILLSDIGNVIDNLEHDKNGNLEQIIMKLRSILS